MTFRDDFRRDVAEFIEARDAFVATLVKELRIEWMLRKLTQAIVWCEKRLRIGGQNDG
jgi:hypothetical protein